MAELLICAVVISKSQVSWCQPSWYLYPLW